MAVHTLTGRTDSTQNGDDRKEGRRVYAAIDLKSFYASVECRERGLDPLKTLLVVADLSRTEKTICLAVSPSLKAYGIPGRPRLFEVVQAVERINRDRLAKSGLPALPEARRMPMNSGLTRNTGWNISSPDRGCSCTWITARRFIRHT